LDWGDTTPTTGSAMNSGLVTGLTGGPGTPSEPDVELKSTVEPSAAAAFLKPRAVAVRSVSTTSTAESDFGSRPAISVMSGEESRGGSETIAPAGREAGVGDAPPARDPPGPPALPPPPPPC